MDYKETLSYLYARLPMFTRIGAAAYKKDLHNTISLCARLGNPQDKFRSVHVGGTNGKGSTSHMLAAILQTAGYKTGLYTSPHLLDFRERIRINGKMIPEGEIIDFVKEIQSTIEEIDPSFFEVTVAMAFDYFAREKVDIAIIEVGLGGRLDSTNIIAPLVSVITNISYDHTNLLGNTLPEIATEKAGIIKKGVPVVIGERQEEVEDVFVLKAKESGAKLIFASEEWTMEERKQFQLDLSGSYQLKNCATVLSAVKQLELQGFQIEDIHIREALSNVKNLTGLAGRWQTLGTNPLIIADTGHNLAGIKEVIQNIKSTPHKNLHIVFGMVKDKDISSILQLLPKEAVYYFCQPDIERAKSAEELYKEAEQAGLKGKTYSSVKLAYEAAKQHASPDDLIFAGGSTFVVAEVL